LLKPAASYWLVKGVRRLAGLVGGPKRGQVTAPQRALLYLAVMYLAIEVPPSVILKVFNVLERTEVMRVKK